MKGTFKEKTVKGTSEKCRKSKSTDKPKGIVEPFGKVGNQEENIQQAIEESRHQESQGNITSVI